MKSKLTRFLRVYRATLQRHLKQDPRAGARKSKGPGSQAVEDGLDGSDLDGLGDQALAHGLDASELVRIHGQALIEIMPRESIPAAIRNGMIERASMFFANTITPVAKAHRAALETNALLMRRNQALSKRPGESAATAGLLKKEIVRRKAAEKALTQFERHHIDLLEKSRQMQEQLRRLSHQILLSQEAERKEISRELHDQIAQVLTGINVHLTALKYEAAANKRGLTKKITSAQRLVAKSVDIVHRFARELRPTVLDDLGLVPAVNSYLKEFTKRTSLRVQVTTFPGIEQLNSDGRTVLYRVAQAALTNVARHAKANAVFLNFTKMKSDICMEIHDDGKSFEVEKVLFAKRHKRLGLIGMRERVEMVGGSFAIESAPGKGTTIKARIPFRSAVKV